MYEVIFSVLYNNQGFAPGLHQNDFGMLDWMGGATDDTQSFSQTVEWEASLIQSKDHGLPGLTMCGMQICMHQRSVSEIRSVQSNKRSKGHENHSNRQRRSSKRWF